MLLATHTTFQLPTEQTVCVVAPSPQCQSWTCDQAAQVCEGKQLMRSNNISQKLPVRLAYPQKLHQAVGDERALAPPCRNVPDLEAAGQQGCGAAQLT